MLYATSGLLGGMWLLGLATGITMGGFIHLLLIISVVMVLAALFTQCLRLN